MISRIIGSPLVHRLLAFTLALVGGHNLGQALRATGAGPLLDFGPLYVGAWMVRQGRRWADLYDPVFFSGVVSEIAPAGRIVDLGATPPALVLLAYPFTWMTPGYGKLLFALSGSLLLLLGLFALGAGRTLGWNRSEWIGFAGLVLGSAAVAEGVLRGNAAPWIAGIVALAVAAHALERRLVAAVVSAFAANLALVGWGPLLFSLWRGPRSARTMAGLVACGGLLLQLLALGSAGSSLLARAWARAWFAPPAWDGSWVGRLVRWGRRSDLGTPGEVSGDMAGDGSGLLLALVAVALVAMLARGLVPVVRSHPTLWGGLRDGTARRLGADPPRLSGVASALLVGLCLLGAPETVRGLSMVWAIPTWAALVWLESRPGTGTGLTLVGLALCLLLPSPIGRRLGPDGSANLIALAAIGLVAWWWARLRTREPGGEEAGAS